LKDFEKNYGGIDIVYIEEVREKHMTNNKRPEHMERITTRELAEAFIEDQIKALRTQVGGKNVLLALSGGVDSSVVAALLIKAVGKQLICVHVNHGMLRKGECVQVIEVFRNQMEANLIYVDAVDRFLDKLAGVSDPEQKRKIIGAEFIPPPCLKEEAPKVWRPSRFWRSGTIYPDILESRPGQGTS
jgi:GMP synthase (glutamine-hydrolysing)